MKSKLLFTLYLFLLFVYSLNAQSTFTADLKNALCGIDWKGKFVSAELIKKDSSEAIMITKTEGGQVVWLDNFIFKNGIIEFDAMGKSGPPQSNFVGIAFRVVDQNTYDAIYFRPFNFRSPNPLNKSHSVQYISQPDWTWQHLRGERTGEYEKSIEPAPDGDSWFHAKIVVQKPEVKVYINGANEPSLIVNELSDRKDGSVGLWCNGFGVIANLRIEEIIDK
jgi:hypothetical protein